MKQGSLHKAFKYRYFVLYPGFLVYYDSETKWRVDLAKGETLGVRAGEGCVFLERRRGSCARFMALSERERALAGLVFFTESTRRSLYFGLFLCTLRLLLCTYTHFSSLPRSFLVSANYKCV